jgi:hypothetical protein
VVVHHAKATPIATGREAVGLGASRFAPSAPTARRPVMPTPASCQPTQTRGFPAQSEAGGVTFSLLHRMEYHGTGAPCLQGRLASIRMEQTVVSPEPLAGKKGASQLVSA